MKISTRRSLGWVALACLCVLSVQARTQDLEPQDQMTDVQAVVATDTAADNNEIVTVGGNSTLAKGKSADAVVSVFGSSTSEGDVANSVVSVVGNSRVTGPVGDSVVAIAGGAYVNSKVHGDVVAVAGNIELGPSADIGGDVTAIGGLVKRDPAAIVHGNVQNVGAGVSTAFSWLRPWVAHCLLYGRPLAIAPGIGWAWGLALGFLALYLLLAVLFRGAIDRCVATLEMHPGQSLLAALLTLLLTPVVFIILCITVIGIAAVPFLAVGLFCAGLFGRTVVLAALGRRVTTQSAATSNQTALAVLVGGVIVLGLYLIPFVGFIIYYLVGMIGLGVVVYTLILAARSHRPESPATAAAAPGASAQAAPELAAAEPPIAPAAENKPMDGSEVPGSGAPPPSATATAAPAVAPNALDASTLPRAGFWIRMGALALDALLVGIVLGVLWHHTFRLELLVLATYAAVMWKLRGTTIGGVVFSLKVVRLDGRSVDWATAIVRALGCFLSLAVLWLGFLWIVFDAGRQAWHDKIAGTAVVRVPKGVPLL